MSVEMVTIPKEEYNELLDEQLWLQALEATGVDNWEGYDEARQYYREMKNETSN